MVAPVKGPYGDKQTLHTLCLLVKSIYFLLMTYTAGLGKWVPVSDSSVGRATDVPESRGQVQIKEPSKDAAPHTAAGYL